MPDANILETSPDFVLHEKIINAQPGSLTPEVTSLNTPEEKKTPLWFRRVVKKITDAWFDPKSFEQNPELYKKLGVKTFKKWMPGTGDIAHIVFWERLDAGNFITPNSIESLRRYETFTRVCEVIHLTALTLGVTKLIINLQAGNIDSAIFATTINTLFNVYPILVQRYNRSRLYKAITRMESRNKATTHITDETVVPKTVL
jgi:hypothetical protein